MLSELLCCPTLDTQSHNDPGRARLRAVNRIKCRGAAAIAALTLLPLLAGCYNGFDAGTQEVGTGGDTAQGQVGNIKVQGANWVRSLKDVRILTLVATFVNTAQAPDVLTGVSTDPTPAGLNITGSSLNLAGMNEVRTGFNSNLYINAYGLDTPPSSFVATTFTFKNAGVVTIPILTVPAVGIYAGIEPISATNPAGAIGSPDGKVTALATPSASAASPSATKP